MTTTRYRLLVTLLVALATPSQAVTPPPRKTLAERVALASHICVGVVKSVRVVELRDGKVQEVVPQKKTANFDQFTELEIEVREAMLPGGWKPAGRIKYLFGGGNFDVASIGYDTRDKELIYLLKESAIGKEMYYLPSWHWNLCDSLKSRPEIQAILDAGAKANPA